MQPYSREFYRTHGAGPGGSAEIIVPLVLSLLTRSVFDVGCVLGTWLSVFEESGVKGVFGIDGDHVYWGPAADDFNGNPLTTGPASSRRKAHCLCLASLLVAGLLLRVRAIPLLALQLRLKERSAHSVQF